MSNFDISLPGVSVLMTVYNTKSEWLVEAIDSILRQTYKNFELIIVNDGSINDETNLTLNNYNDNPIINLITFEKNLGRVSALNEGLKKCQNELIFIFDSDDIAFENAIEEQVKCFINLIKENENVSVLGCQLNFVDAITKERKNSTNHVNRVISKKVFSDITNKDKYWFVNHAGSLIKKSVLLNEKINGYDPKLKNSFPEDFDLWMRLLTEGYSIYNNDQVLYDYRVFNNENSLNKKCQTYEVKEKQLHLIKNLLKSAEDDKLLFRVDDLEKDIKIPKIIHQMWIGPKPAPMEMIQTWIDKHPEWQHILWTDDLIKEKYPNGFKNQKHIDEHETWNGKCDIMRYEILHEYGGVFLDADCICLNTLDEHFLEHDSFSCFENEELREKLIACGYMGSIKGCALMKICIEELANTPDLKQYTTGLHSWQSVGPRFFTNVIKKHQYPISIYPSYVFIPNHYTGWKYKGNGKSYADQKWGSTVGYDKINSDIKKDNLKIGLSCIVKNESKVILKMLESVTSIIDYWHIVDTGSTDGTQEIIKNFFNEKNIQGHLTEIEWKDFSTSRNVALNGLKGKVDWGFWIDADEIVEYENNFNKDSLLKTLKNVDGCFLTTNYNRLQYKRMNFFNLKSDADWEWFGPVHEYLKSDKNNNKIVVFEECKVLVGKHFGNSWTSQNLKQKYEKYINILKKYIDENPNQDNSRWVFYLAQSYKDTGSPEYYDDTIKWYLKRLKLEGYSEEKYISQLNISKFKIISKKYSIEEIISSFLNCTIYNSNRIDHFEWIIEYYLNNKNWELAYLYSSYAVKKSLMSHFMFANTDLYNWKIYDLHCMICFYTGRKKEMKDYGETLNNNLKNEKVPEQFLNRVNNNLKFYLQ